MFNFFLSNFSTKPVQRPIHHKTLLLDILALIAKTNKNSGLFHATLSVASVCYLVKPLLVLFQPQTIHQFDLVCFDAAAVALACGDNPEIAFRLLI
jgi:hypothetical protein